MMDDDVKAAPQLSGKAGVAVRRGFFARNQRFGWLVLAIIAAGLFIWWLKPSGQSAQGHNGAMGPTPVGIAVAQARDVHIQSDALGTVTPLATVSIRPQVNGTIVQIHFQEGDHVKAGQVLAEIDPRPYQAALDQAKGTLARDMATLTNDQLNLKRYQALAKTNSISEQTLTSQIAAVQADEAVVVSDKANVESAALNLGYTKITAPVAGLVGLRQVDIGNLVTSGQSANIAVVTQMQPMSIIFTVPEGLIDAIRARIKAGGTLEADAYDRTNTKRIATGKLISTDNEVDPTTGTVKLRSLSENSDDALFPGQFVNVRLTIDTLHGQTTIPSAALQQGAQGAYVYVVNPNKTVSLRLVTAGVTDNGFVQIIKGLKPGDTVVVDGTDRLSDGAEVSLPDAKALKIQTPSAAPQGSRPAELVQGHSGHGMFALFRKLTPAERAQLHGMDQDQRRAWLQAHKAELEKRPDQPGAGAGHGQDH